MIPGNIFTGFAKFQGIVSVNDFLVSSSAPGISVSSSGSPGKIFWFARLWLYPLCCQVLYQHGMSMTVPRLNFFTKNFVICSNQVIKMFRSGHDCTSTSSARSPCYFCLQADIIIWVLRKVPAYPNLVPLLLAAPLEVHEMTWKCLDFFALGFPKALLKYFHQQINSP